MNTDCEKSTTSARRVGCAHAEPAANVQAIADIRYVASARAKNLRITIRPDCTVTVTIPRRATKQQVQEFVASRQDWIAKHITKFRRRQPKDLPVADLSKIDLCQAQDTIFARLEAFSKQHGLDYRRAAFRCQKTKWGSCCASTRSISLNINMTMLPEHLQDYLLLHELTHLKHPNHSPAFWAELDRYCAGHAKRLSKELKTYPLMLIGSKE
jgi:predicted metal-dependent hydrolase